MFNKKDKRLDNIMDNITIIQGQILDLHRKLENIIGQFDNIRERIDNRAFDLLTHNIDASVIEKIELKLKDKYLKQKWLLTDADQVNEINKILQSTGGELLDLKRKLHDLYIRGNKKGEDTKYIEGQLNIIDKILEAHKHA